jgi:cell wall-associated NlpC family hydrolase
MRQPPAESSQRAQSGAARSGVRRPLADEAAQRAAIVAEARRWIGTPYHDNGDILGAGVDCGMLLVRTFLDLGLVPPFDPRPYPRDWMMHNDEEKYLGWVKENCGEVEKPKPGDIAVFRFGRCYSHGGVITGVDPLTLVHAYALAQVVIEEGIAQNGELTKPARKVRFFSIWAGRGIV